MPLSLPVVTVFSLLLGLWVAGPAAATLAPMPSVQPLQPVSAVSLECVAQPYAAVSGAFSLGDSSAQGSGAPAMVFTLGAAPYLYATDVWGTLQTPISLYADRVARMASANARLRGAGLRGGSLYLVFARNDELGPASVLQIDQPWSNSPVFKYHPLGMVRVWDVVTNSDALYMLTQPRTVDTETTLLRFDMARGTLMSVRLPFSGGKLRLTPDQKYLLAAGPSNNATLCEAPSFIGGCAFAYALDPTYLRQLSTYTEEEGGCAVHAISSTKSGELYLASASGPACTSFSFTGYLTINGSWELVASAESFDHTTAWVVPALNSWDGFVVGVDGLVSTTGRYVAAFSLQTALPVISPLSVTDATLGPCLVFPASACQAGTLSLYIYNLGQFTSTVS